MTPAELAVHRVNTAVFIAADPVTVAVTHHTRVRTPSGGYTTTTSSAGTLIFRLLPQSGPTRTTETPDGALASVAYVLLTYWDTDIRRGDTFELKGVEYQVASPIWPEHSTDSVYERKAAVVRRG